MKIRFLRKNLCIYFYVAEEWEGQEVHDKDCAELYPEQNEVMEAEVLPAEGMPGCVVLKIKSPMEDFGDTSLPIPKDWIETVTEQPVGGS